LLLRKSWKNDIFECVQQVGLNPLSFEWVEENTEFPDCNWAVSVLRHPETGYYFKFDRIRDESFACKFCPGSVKLEEKTGSTTNWDSMKGEVKRWLSYVKKEIATDLWEQLKEYTPQETFIGTAEISNAPFSYSEAENIIGSLDKLQAQIEKNFNLHGDQLAFVKREIDYLKDAAKRQGRKDWMHTSIGVIMTIAVGLALSPEKTKLLWDLLKSCFGGILQLSAP